MHHTESVFLVRVQLPDRPGSLGAVASALGGICADINAVEIVEKGEEYVVDDFILDLPPDRMPESIFTACQALAGVSVEWISRYPEGGGLQSDLEALERMTADPDSAAETLVASSPVVFRSHWAVLLDVAEEPKATFSSPLAPDLEPDQMGMFAPFTTVHRLDLAPEWLPGWGESTAVLAPLAHDRAIVIGRLGGPRFLDSEVARLGHLAALVS